MDRGRLTAGALLLVLAASVAVTGYSSTGQTGHVTGRDGYYYLVQMKSLATTGEMHSPEYSPVYIPLMLLYYLTGNYISAYRISAVLLKLLFVMSVYAFCRSLMRSEGASSGNRRYVPLLAAALSAASPSMNYFFTQFPKNMLGFSLFLYFASAVETCALKRGKGRALNPGILPAAFLFAAAFFTHRFSAILSLMFLAAYFLPAVPGLFRKFISRRERNRGRYMIPAAAALFFLLLILLLSSILPLAPSLADLPRITGDLSGSPIFVPAAFMEVFGSFRITWPWRVELFLAPLFTILSVLLLTLGRRSAGGRRRSYAAVAVIALTGLFPFFEFSMTGIAYRLLFSTLLFWPVVLLPLIVKLAELLQRSGWAPAAAILLLTALSFYTGRSYDPGIHDPPYDFYSELAAEVMDALEGVDQELIIAHGALAEMITYTYGVDALPWSPEEEFRRDRVWRVTAGILRDEVSYYLSPADADSFFADLRSDYGLIREDRWEDFLEAISGSQVMMEAVDSWRNPMETRPSFLTEQ